jgi:hypothetical protein
MGSLFHFGILIKGRVKGRATNARLGKRADGQIEYGCYSLNMPYDTHITRCFLYDIDARYGLYDDCCCQIPTATLVEMIWNS